MDQLFDLLDGLPLAIAHAGAYLQQSGVSLSTYLTCYKEQWGELMRTSNEVDSSLSDYPNRNLWTTWSITFNAVSRRDPNAANLLLLWSHLGNQDLWFEMFATAFAASQKAAVELPTWIKTLASNRLLFTQAMMVLRRYSLIESSEKKDSYTSHRVVHRWVRYCRGRNHSNELSRLAAVIIGLAVPQKRAEAGPTLQRRLLPHADACLELLAEDIGCKNEDGMQTKQCETYLKSIHEIGILYTNVSRPKEAEALYLRVLQGSEKWGSKHIMVLKTLHNLGDLYASLGRFKEAEDSYQRVLTGFEETRGLKDTLTLDTVNNLGILFKNQGRLKEAEGMYLRALKGKEEVYGMGHTSTLETVNNLGVLYRIQGQLQDAEALLLRALEGNERIWGSGHNSTLDALSNLGLLYATQRRPKQAENAYLRALEGRETIFGPRHTSTLDIIHNLGNLFASLGRVEEAERMYTRALEGYEEALGANHVSFLGTINSLGSIRRRQGRLGEAERLFLQALAGYERTCGPDHTATLDALLNLGNVQVDLDRWPDAEATYKRALHGFERAEGNHQTSILYLRERLPIIRDIQGTLTSIMYPMSRPEQY